MVLPDLPVVERPAQTRYEVVLVEDDPGDALLAQELLVNYGTEFEVTWVRSLADAVAAIGPRTECVLLDLGLPDTTDLEGLEAILALASRPAVVVFTGFADRESGERAVALGAQDYLAKGAVNDETLARAVRYAIARRRVEESSKRLREAALIRAENARLERGLLPHPIVANAALSWATHYRAGDRRALLGGDFYDFVETADKTIRILVGDVSGHGPDEAALGVALRVGWRALVLAGQAPEPTLEALEFLLEAERAHDGVFATLCDLTLDSALGRAEIRLGGHPTPLVLRDGVVVEVDVDVRHTVLGAFGIDGWQASTVELGSDWALVVFTDGLIEGRANGSGSDRLGSAELARLATRAFAEADSLQSVAEALVHAAEEAHGGPLPDDVALILVSASPRWKQ
jgi:serine phosphatase RsbU (regulator of sigma subunit)